jgi:protein SCO1/2
MLKKALVLLITLALPVGIYLFLEGFGDNRYDVPVYHTMDPATSMDYSTNASSFIAKAANLNPNGTPKSNIKVLSFLAGNSEANDGEVYLWNLTRSYDAFIDHSDIVFITVALPGVGQGPDLTGFKNARDAVIPESDRWFIHTMRDQQTSHAFLTSGLGFASDDSDPSYKIVLVDTENRVRGYYSGLDEEDTERMILETRILIDDAASQ